MAGTVLDVETLISPDTLGQEISAQWQEWHSFRQEWLAEKKELRNYLYATDTTHTTNAKLPWANSTTVPKLTQIYDNLKANYSAALFPNSDWIEWEPEDTEADTLAKRRTIKAYVKNKVKLSGFRKTALKLLDDWIIYGNCFATVEFQQDYTELGNGDFVQGYIGPRLVRISPYDIVFNPAAANFQDSPKIIRSIVTLGELQRQLENGEDYPREVFSKMLHNRKEMVGWTDTEKSEAFIADGFGSIQHYYQSNYVEILTFYGDIYDTTEGKLRTNRIIRVVDRAYVISDEPMPSWLGSDNIFHSGWRNRPDNLYAMGPLDNLVGMQYRIDHLENLKADVFDQIALPVLKVRGDVEEFNYSPGSRIYMGEEGDVGYLAPDATALNADFQIAELERRMEEMAGAPRESLGIRTPGEKTKFEIQTLSAASGRIFQHKAEQLESELFQPVLMAFLEAGRRNLTNSEVLKVFNSDAGVEMFKTITPEDIAANGKIVPKGASHFVESANRVQNLSQLINIKQSDPTIGVHISGKMIAELLAREMGEDKLYQPNVTISEQMETQNAMDDKEADYQDRLATLAEQGM